MGTSTPENEILKPRDPSLIDSNDWPDFQLEDVEVFDPRSEMLSSLLFADESRPLCVTGRLGKAKDRIGYLLNRRLHDTLPTRILIQNVQTWSYGQSDTGDIILWAGGQAGWFELSPGRTYKDIFKNDSEAINCLYFLADLYRELKGPQRRKIALDEVFQSYAEEPRHSCRSVNAAEEIFLRHRAFLVDCMEKGKEGQSWRSTSIYSFLRDALDEDEDAMMADGDTLPPPVTPAHNTADPRSSHAGKGKSTLRPKSKKNKGPSQRITDDDMDLDSSEGTPTHPDGSSIPQKRKGPDLSSARSRRLRYRESQDEDIDASINGAETTADAPLPFRSTNGRKKPARAKSPPVRLRTHNQLTFDATMVGDVWVCPFDGCTRRVYAASTPANRALIKEHYQQHAYDAQAQIDLVYAEERPYLPVGKLVERIRAMAAQRDAQQAKSGATATGVESVLLKPIEQRY